jgi:WD40 repeat protein
MPPSGRLVAAGCANNAIEVFDVVSGSRVASLARHTNWVAALAVSADGRILVSASHDSTAR